VNVVDLESTGRLAEESAAASAGGAKTLREESALMTDLRVRRATRPVGSDTADRSASRRENKLAGTDAARPLSLASGCRATLTRCSRSASHADAVYEGMPPFGAARPVRGSVARRHVVNRASSPC